jgi:pimeloyl-ACP methyl ester carboxylesterase
VADREAGGGHPAGRGVGRLSRTLLLPGNDLDGPFYAGLCEALRERGHDVEALSIPAFLGRHEGPADWEGLSEHVSERLGAGAVLLGHSLGGLLALLVAARREDLRGLVLLEPAIAPWVSLARKAARAYRRDVVERDRDRFVNWTGTFRRIHRPERFPAAAMERYLTHRRDADPAIVGGLLEALPDLYPLPFEQVRAPVLLLRGARSGWRAGLGAWTLARVLPRARVQTVPAAGHWLANEADDAVADAVAPFISSCAASSADPAR